MDILYFILDVLQYLLIAYFGMSSLYFFVFALASVFSHKLKKQNTEKENRFCVLIPAYKEDNIIVSIAEDALKQKYPKDKYDVYVIADSLNAQTVQNLRNIPVQTIEVSFDISTKSKALNTALEQIPEIYNIAIVLDADNLMEPEFLSKMNRAFSKGIIAVQGHRIAKNTNTTFALLDAISEEINNNIFRKGQRNIGFSAALIGSAMGFDFMTFKKVMKDINAVGGFDKQLELKLIKQNIRIQYLQDAYVLDEKIQDSTQFSNQRRRWLYAQFYYLRKDFFISFWYFVSKGNIDYFNKAFQFIQLPRILMLGILVIGSFINLILGITPFMYIWSVFLLMAIMGFMFAVPAKHYNINTLKALISLPKGFYLMFKVLLKLKGANTKFIHTEHSIKTVDDSAFDNKNKQL
ncbi:MAG: glycosyltransferase family 2 protein [Bacteroidales bacterium]|nr:glycosyltransferase family 2 protein [Bacteroidales bacterium]